MRQRKPLKTLKNSTSTESTDTGWFSNVLLKQLNESITYPMTLIFNQSIQEGVFPERMKMAEIIPLYQGKKKDFIVNY